MMLREDKYSCGVREESNTTHFRNENGEDMFRHVELGHAQLILHWIIIILCGDMGAMGPELYIICHYA